MRPVDAEDTATLTIGDIEVFAVVDALTSLPTAPLFADTPLPWPSPELDRLFPEDFTDGRWRFMMRSFVLRHPGGLALVDAGAGPAGRPLCRELQIEGRLIESLRQIGIIPSDITDVVITHSHDDHVGWLTRPTPVGPRPTFPEAVYHLHPADLTIAQDRTDERGRQYWHEVFAPLVAAGQFALHPNSYPLAPGIELVNAPGHTPGHRIVSISAGPHRMSIVGDLLHFSYQLRDPELPSPFDTQPKPAAAARRAVLRTSPHAIIASPHLPHAFTSPAVPTDTTR